MNIAYRCMQTCYGSIFIPFINLTMPIHTKIIQIIVIMAGNIIICKMTTRARLFNSKYEQNVGYIIKIKKIKNKGGSMLVINIGNRKLIAEL